MKLIALIIGLDFASSPAAIAWFIVAVVVYAVYAQLGIWSWSHVGQKIFKILPSLTDFNAPSAVAMPFFSLWVFTAETHGIPNVVFSRSFPIHETGMPMAQVTRIFLANFLKQATATFCVSNLERVCQYLQRFTARTSAVPNSSTIFVYEGEG